MMTAARHSDHHNSGPGTLSVHSHDPAEAHVVGTEVYHPHQLTVLGDETSFGMRLKAASLGPVTVGWLAYETEVRIKSPGFGDSYQVNVLTNGTMRARAGADEIVAGPRIGMFYSPSDPTAFIGWRTPDPLFALKIERYALEHELERLLGRSVSQPIDVGLKLDLTGHQGTEWLRLASAVAHAAVDDASLFRDPMVATPLIESLLTGLLIIADHNARDELDSPRRAAGPAAVRTARAFIEEHAAQPLTVPRIAAHVGLSVRALQQSFQRCLGMTPGQVVRQVRLEAAHRDLVAHAPDEVTVASIAVRWGFPHAGRFASAYRETYGVTPSETLRHRT